MQVLDKEKNNQLIRKMQQLLDPRTPLGAQLRMRRIDDHTLKMGDYMVSTDPHTQTHSVYLKNNLIVQDLHWQHSATVIVEHHIRGNVRRISEIQELDHQMSLRYHDLWFLNHVIEHGEEERRAALAPRRHWIRQQLEYLQRAICRHSILLKKLP